MRNSLISIVILAICILALGKFVITCSGKLINSVEREKLMYSCHIGDTIVLNSDTLIVVDFNIGKETYTLSNELIVDKKLVMKNK